MDRTLIFTLLLSQYISQKISMLSLSPLFHIENVYNVFMTELMSAIIPKSSPSVVAHSDSFFLSPFCSLTVFNSIPFSTGTQRVILILCVGVLPSHFSVNSGGQTPGFIHPLFLLHCPEQMRLQQIEFGTKFNLQVKD